MLLSPTKPKKATYSPSTMPKPLTETGMRVNNRARGATTAAQDGQGPGPHPGGQIQSQTGQQTQG